MRIRPYNKSEILETIDKFGVTKNNLNVVTTTFGDKIVASESVSDKYYVFDFGKFTREIVENIENYFTPISYTILISKGYQEIRIFGEEVIINGDIYDKMVSILNSTDKSRTLQMNIGLFRKINQSGIIIDVENATVRGKHFFKSLPERLKMFVLQLQNFNIVIEAQTVELTKLANLEITFKEIAERYIRFDKRGIVRSGDVTKLRAFSSNLKNSTSSDRVVNLTSEQRSLLFNSSRYQEYDTDIYLNGFQVFNIYTELFKNYDTSVLRRESKRIMDVIYDKYDKDENE